MNIIVCIKQVPDTEIQAKLDSQGKLDFSSAKFILNPYDEFAIEEALQAKAKHFPNATVTAITLGESRSADVLRTALAMGCDKAMHVLVENPTGWLSSLSVGLALAQAIRPVSAHLIFCGKQGIDHDNLIVPYTLAEALGYGCINVVQKVEYQSDKAVITRESDSATKEFYSCTFPVVLGVTKGINKPRYPSLPGIMKAKKQTIETLPLSEVLKAEDTHWIQPTRYELPQERGGCKMIEGDVAQQAGELIRILKEDLRMV